MQNSSPPSGPSRGLLRTAALLLTFVIAMGSNLVAETRGELRVAFGLAVVLVLVIGARLRRLPRDAPLARASIWLLLGLTIPAWMAASALWTAATLVRALVFLAIGLAATAALVPGGGKAASRTLASAGMLAAAVQMIMAVFLEDFGWMFVVSAAAALVWSIAWLRQAHRIAAIAAIVAPVAFYGMLTAMLVASRQHNFGDLTAAAVLPYGVLAGAAVAWAVMVVQRREFPASVAMCILGISLIWLAGVGSTTASVGYVLEYGGLGVAAIGWAAGRYLGVPAVAGVAAFIAGLAGLTGALNQGLQVVDFFGAKMMLSVAAVVWSAAHAGEIGLWSWATDRWRWLTSSPSTGSAEGFNRPASDEVLTGQGRHS